MAVRGLVIVEHLDFELSVGDGEGDEYHVEVLRSPAGEARALMRFPFTELDLRDRLKTLEIALLRSGSTRRRVETSSELQVREFGGKLFDALFSGEVRNRFDVSRHEARQKGKGLRIKLRCDVPELASLPWEFLFDPRAEEYLCLSADTPLVRYLELSQPAEALAVKPPLRILGLVCSPPGLDELDVDKEQRRLEETLKPLVARGLVELKWVEETTWRYLHRALRRPDPPWHVFHFVGHGGFDPLSGEGLLLLTGDDGGVHRLPARDLGRLLGDHHALRLAVLNSCEGARADKRDIFSSTAATLVRKGTPAVVAMQYEISDVAALELARCFYESVADGLPVDCALTEARKSVTFALSNSLEWGTPVLYLRAPNGVLFDLTAPPTPPTTPPPVTPAPTHDPATVIDLAAEEKASAQAAAQKEQDAAAHRVAVPTAARPSAAAPGPAPPVTPAPPELPGRSAPAPARAAMPAPAEAPPHAPGEPPTIGSGAADVFRRAVEGAARVAREAAARQAAPKACGPAPPPTPPVVSAPAASEAPPARPHDAPAEPRAAARGRAQFCRKCGAKRAGTGKFCHKCGTSLG